jgi:AsmA family protein
LRDESLDLKVTPQAKRTSLMSLAVPLRISGTLAEPSVGPDPLGTAVGAAKIAGMFLNPLVAGAVIVLDSEMTDQNPCVAALEKPGAGTKKKVAPSSAERAIEETGGALKNAGEEAGKTLKDAGKGAGEALKDASQGAGEALKDAGEGVKEGLRSIFNK